MKNNKNAVLHVWMLPLLFVLACFTACYLAGSLDYRNIIDERSQRDFNAALGMPLIIGYLWLALRILHRRSGKRIADFLVQTNQLSQYRQHMTMLEKKADTPCFSGCNAVYCNYPGVSDQRRSSGL